jgi:long-chain acyl-CoA synthetase
MVGARVVMVPVFSPKVVAELIRTKRPTIMAGVPTLYEALSRDPSLQRADLSCLRAAFCGADTLTRPVKEGFERLVRERGGSVTLLEGYGLTEAVTAIMGTPLHRYREGSIGVPFPDTLAKICRPGTDLELPTGQEGEICVSGPAVMLGYLDDAEATGKALKVHRDGRVWLHTDDLGKMDGEGFFYFTARLKRMIKSSGFNVYPAQVEAVLCQHPAVAAACVVGVPDEAQGQRVKAFVVVEDSYLATPELASELIDFCRARLIKWSCPRDVEFRLDLPQTRLGKIDYVALERDGLVSPSKRVAARSAR